MTGDWIVVVAGLLGMAWAVHLLDKLRTREQRFPGEAGTVWGLLITGGLIALAGISRATGWF